jgi:hypothetical protein
MQLSPYETMKHKFYVYYDILKKILISGSAVFLTWHTSYKFSLEIIGTENGINVMYK